MRTRILALALVATGALAGASVGYAQGPPSGPAGGPPAHVGPREDALSAPPARSHHTGRPSKPGVHGQEAASAARKRGEADGGRRSGNGRGGEGRRGPRAALPEQPARNPAKACAAEREETGEEAFREAYGTNESEGEGHKMNAFGKCVSSRAKAKAETREEAETEETEEAEETGEASAVAGLESFLAAVAGLLSEIL